MTQLIPEIMDVVIDAIITICSLIFTGFVLPWAIKTGIPWLKDKRVYGIVSMLVKAAEKQKEAGTLPMPKPDYVELMLTQRGIKITPNVKAMIEAAVKDLDIAVENAVGALSGIFVEDAPGAAAENKEQNS